MPSIRNFLARGDRHERAARFIEAILWESSLTVVVRDHRGRFIEYNPRSLDEAGVAPEESGQRGERLRLFDGEGRELSLLEAPASVARLTGEAQKGTFGIRYPNGEERWLKGDILPLEPGSEGWAVLSISVDVSDLYIGRRTAQERVRCLEALLAMSQRLGHAGLTAAETAEAMRELMATMLPRAAVALAIRSGDDVQFLPIQDHPDGGGWPRRVRFEGDVTLRWARGTHVNNDVRDTDIYAGHIVGVDAVPVRSVAAVPVADCGGTRIGMLTAYGLVVNAFSPADVAFLEDAARLVGPALDRGLASAV